MNLAALLGLGFATSVFAQGSSVGKSVDPCREVGDARFLSAQTKGCGGIWNIYASIPNGGTWWSDKMATNPAAKRIEQEANQMQERLRRCGIEAHVSLSNWFDSFRPDLAVVHSSPHRGQTEAGEELQRAKQCGIAGYSKKSAYQFAGRD